MLIDGVKEKESQIANIILHLGRCLLSSAS
jgi:hypothetical protein